jgi:hypothetical protein
MSKTNPGLISEEPLHTAKVGDQPIKTTESLIFNGQNKSTDLSSQVKAPYLLTSL